MTNLSEHKRVPIRDGILTSPLSSLDAVTLQGSRCRECGEIALAITSSCQNCAGNDMEVIPLGAEGHLWSYTIVRSRPPGDYKGPEPYVPLVEGLVELPEGIRVLSPLGVEPDKVAIGMELRVRAHVLYRNAEGSE